MVTDVLWPKKLPNEMKLKLHAKIYHGKLGFQREVLRHFGGI